MSSVWTAKAYTQRLKRPNRANQDESYSLENSNKSASDACPSSCSQSTASASNVTSSATMSPGPEVLGEVRDFGPSPAYVTFRCDDCCARTGWEATDWCGRVTEEYSVKVFSKLQGPTCRSNWKHTLFILSARNSVPECPLILSHLHCLSQKLTANTCHICRKALSVAPDEIISQRQ